mmetsp:Transcript_16930/g.48634  ORF Transcript_16930/g.48634 Transcript_16930/m.48634 type:complete len:89 (+) Transcript_16930:1040-1306(+)
MPNLAILPIRMSPLRMFCAAVMGAADRCWETTKLEPVEGKGGRWTTDERDIYEKKERENLLLAKLQPSFSFRQDITGLPTALPRSSFR